MKNFFFGWELSVRIPLCPGTFLRVFEGVNRTYPRSMNPSFPPKTWTSLMNDAKEFFRAFGDKAIENLKFGSESIFSGKLQQKIDMKIVNLLLSMNN